MGNRLHPGCAGARAKAQQQGAKDQPGDQARESARNEPERQAHACGRIKLVLEDIVGQDGAMSKLPSGQDRGVAGQQQQPARGQFPMSERYRRMGFAHASQPDVKYEYQKARWRVAWKELFHTGKSQPGNGCIAP